jgi:hypothetical protein
LPADGERVILRHIATDRAIFARGALRAGAVGRSTSVSPDRSSAALRVSERSARRCGRE